MPQSVLLQHYDGIKIDLHELFAMKSKHGTFTFEGDVCFQINRDNFSVVNNYYSSVQFQINYDYTILYISFLTCYIRLVKSAFYSLSRTFVL